MNAMNGMPAIAVLRVDRHGEILTRNDGAQRWLGACAGKRCCDVVMAKRGRNLTCSVDCHSDLLRTRGAHEEAHVEVRGVPCRLVCAAVGDTVQAVLIPHPDDGASYEALTDREREVLGLVAQGCSNAEIAARLGITTTTVRSHVDNARSKLGARTRAQAVSHAVGRRLI